MSDQPDAETFTSQSLTRKRQTTMSAGGIRAHKLAAAESRHGAFSNIYSYALLQQLAIVINRFIDYFVHVAR